MRAFAFYPKRTLARLTNVGFATLVQAGEEAIYLREQAARCRRLSRDLIDERARVTLVQMAAEYEARASLLAGPLVDGMPHPKVLPPIVE